jgi:hypothetical protein
MEPVTDPNGERGFWDESTGFVPASSMQKVTDPNGVKGYYHDSLGFIPEPSMAEKPATTTTEKKSKGYFDILGEQIGEAYSKYSGDISKYSPLDYESYKAPALADVATSTGQYIGRIVQAPVTAAISSVLPEGTGEFIARNIPQSLRDAASWAKSNVPGLVDAAERSFDILAIPGAVALYKGAAKGVGKVATAATEKLAGTKAGTAIGETAGTLAKDLEKSTEAMLAKERGEYILPKQGMDIGSRVREQDFWGGWSAAPSKMDSEIIAELKGKFPRWSSSPTAKESVEEARSAVHKNRLQLLNEHRAPVDRSMIDTAMENIRKSAPELYGTETANLAAYDKAIKVFGKYLDQNTVVEKGLKGTTRTLDNYGVDNALVQVRKELEKIYNMKDQYNPARVALDRLTDSTRGIVADSLGEWKDAYLRMRTSEALLISAREMIEANIRNKSLRSSIDTVKGWIEHHPVLFMGATVSGSKLAAVLKSPVIFSLLAGYGTYNLGKSIVTSEAVRGQLIRGLKAMEKSLTPAEKEATQRVIYHLSAKPLADRATLWGKSPETSVSGRPPYYEGIPGTNPEAAARRGFVEPPLGTVTKPLVQEPIQSPRGGIRSPIQELTVDPTAGRPPGGIPGTSTEVVARRGFVEPPLGDWGMGPGVPIQQAPPVVDINKPLVQELRSAPRGGVGPSTQELKANPGAGKPPFENIPGTNAEAAARRGVIEPPLGNWGLEPGVPVQQARPVVDINQPLVQESISSPRGGIRPPAQELKIDPQAGRPPFEGGYQPPPGPGPTRGPLPAKGTSPTTGQVATSQPLSGGTKATESLPPQTQERLTRAAAGKEIVAEGYKMAYEVKGKGIVTVDAPNHTMGLKELKAKGIKLKDITNSGYAKPGKTKETFVTDPRDAL